jgi:hypothetical protein
MQEVSAEYAARVESGHQPPAVRMTVDWYRSAARAQVAAPTAAVRGLAGPVASLSVPVPSGVLTDDVVVVWLYREAASPVNPPTGFVLKDTIACTGAQAHQLTVWWRRARAADAGSYLFQWTGSASAEGIARRHAGIDTAGDPFDATNTAQRSSSGTVTPAVSLATFGADRTVLWAGTCFNGGAVNPPTGFTLAAQGGVSFVAAKAQPAAGATGSLTGSFALAGWETAWVGALRPLVLPPPAEVVPASVTVRRSITSDLPGEVTLIAGVSAATADVELTGNPRDNAETAAVLYSPYQDEAALADVDVEGVPVTIELGMLGEGDPELFQVIGGTGRDMEVSTAADGSSAGWQIVDARDERFRFHPTIPLIVADDSYQVTSGAFFWQVGQHPGLNSSFLVDAIFRQAGYYASPPARANCVALSTLHGSLYPEVGTPDPAVSSGLIGAGGFDAPDSAAFTPGPWGLAATGRRTDGASGFAQTNTVRTAAFSSGTGVLYEGWVYRPAVDPAFTDGLIATSASDLITALRTEVDFQVLSSAGWKPQITWSLVTGGVQGGLVTVTPSSASLALPAGQWSYVAAHAFWTSSTSVTVQFRVNGNSEDVVQAAAVVDSAYRHISQSSLTIVAPTQDVQISATTALGPSWNDAFVRTAIVEPGMNELMATPPLDAAADAWATLQAMAKAEAGTVLADETGMPQFWSRDHWRTAPAALNVQRTLRVSIPLKHATVRRLTDQVRNIVQVPVTPYTVSQPRLIWMLSGTGDDIRISARGSKVVAATFTDAQAYQVDTRTHVIPPAGAESDMRSGYRAAKALDGTGAVTNLTMTVEAAGNSVTITWTNPNPYAVYLVSPKGAGNPPSSDGLPYAALIGRLVSAAAIDTDTGNTVGQSGYVIQEQAQESIDRFGPRPLPALPQTPWMQRGTSGRALGKAILHSTYLPCPQLSSVEIVGDAALQLGDRVQVLDDSDGTDGAVGTGLDDPFWIAEKTDTYSGGDSATYSQPLTLRPVARPRQWIWDVPGRNIPDVSLL